MPFSSSLFLSLPPASNGLVMVAVYFQAHSLPLCHHSNVYTPKYVAIASRTLQPYRAFELLCMKQRFRSGNAFCWCAHYGCSEVLQVFVSLSVCVHQYQPTMYGQMRRNASMQCLCSKTVRFYWERRNALRHKRRLLSLWRAMVYFKIKHPVHERIYSLTTLWGEIWKVFQRVTSQRPNKGPCSMNKLRDAVV